MNLCDLPDDILCLVLEATMSHRGRIALPFDLAVSLLTVCRRLRLIVLRLVYGTATLYVGGRREPMDEQPTGASPNLELAVSAGCAQCVRQLIVKVGYDDASIDALRAAAERLRAAAGKLAGILSLNFYMAAKKRMLGWDGVDAADHETDIQAICSDIIAAIPEVRFLAVILKSPDSVTQELTRRLAVHYSGQLEDLAIAGPVAIPRGRKFKQLKRLGLNYDYISTSRVPCINPAGLEVLVLQGRLTTTAWASFVAGARSRELTFANLKTLYLASSPPTAMPSSATQPHSRSAWRLYFPSLRYAHIHCKQGPFPVLEWAVLPPRMALLKIEVAPALLRVIDEVVGIPAARQFTLMVPRGFGDDPAVLAVVGRIFEKAHKCETRELVAPDNASPLLVDMVASAPVTHLTLHMASMGVVTDMIRRTSSVTTLSIIRLNTDSAQPDILAPSPDGGHTVEPLNTSITELCLGWYPVEWHPDAVLAAKCLLLAIPSLLRLVASDALIQQLAEFTNARSTCYPYRPNPSPYSRWWLA